MVHSPNFRDHKIGIYERFVEWRVEEALSDTPAVLIVGPRRAGETTLVRKMGEAGRTYITLDDHTTLDAARSDPVGFIRGLDQAIIDEIQRAPDLLLAIKKTVHEEYRPGRFLLTGFLGTPVQWQAAGRPGGNRRRRSRQARAHRRISRSDQPRQRAARQDWARSYLTSVLTRDLRDIADIEKLTELPKFVRLLAEHSGQLVNYSQFGGSINVSHKTGQRYVALLEQVFPRCDIAALVHERADADRQDAETAFPRFRAARHNARIGLRTGQGEPR